MMSASPSPSPSAILDLPGSYVPYARRRNTPAQLDALHKLFETTPHPTRTQRQALADETGMELKSVTNWFQNRRQTTRRKSLSLSENNPMKTRLPHSPSRHRYRRSKTPLDRSKISLDHIAALSERSSLTTQRSSPRIPLTPRKSNVQQKKPSSPSELWTHMLSSPVVPPSSPDTEEARLAVLSSRAKTLFSLDWACLKARHKKWVDEDVGGVLKNHTSGCREEAEEDGTEPDVINPRSDTIAYMDASNLDEKKASFSRVNLAPQFEDVEAAITLLGFRTCS